MYRLSNERCLYLRMTSPHEVGEYVDARSGGKGAANFLDKTEEKITANTPNLGKRWNFACPLQPNAANRMPDLVEGSVYLKARQEWDERYADLVLGKRKLQITRQPRSLQSKSF
jgi:hypothetical protein